MKSKNKFIIIALICLITISSVWAGRTYAYFNASSNASGTITMGALKVNDFGELDADTSLKVVPNQTVTKNFKATIESDIKYYKRLSLTATVDVETGKSHDSTCGDYVDDDTKILNATVQSFEKYESGNEIYYYDLAPVTPTNTTTDENFTVNIAIHDWVGTGGCDYYMGATIKVNIKVEVIQADYLEDNVVADATTFTTATALHTVWTACCPTIKPYNVTLSTESLDASSVVQVYYAVDGETSITEIGADPISINASKIILIFSSESSYAGGGDTIPDWTIEKNNLHGISDSGFVGEITTKCWMSIVINGSESFSDNIYDGYGDQYMLLLEITQNTNIVTKFTYGGPIII